jgi:4-hydroxy-tetrahydrodipicolinate synthase
MNVKIFRGTGVALVTPFTADHAIDFVALEQLVNHVINQGVHYLVALGTTAETPTLSADEKKRYCRL